MKKTKFLAVLIAVPIGLSACAGLRVNPIVSADDEKTSNGFRYFESAQFLFIHTDGKGGLTGEIVMLPDTTREMSIEPYATLAANNTTLAFTNGVLTETNSQVDTTAVASAATDALAKYLTGLVAGDIPKPTAPPPYLYKIYVKNGVVSLLGGPPRVDASPNAGLFEIRLPNDITGAAQE